MNAYTSLVRLIASVVLVVALLVRLSTAVTYHRTHAGVSRYGVVEATSDGTVHYPTRAGVSRYGVVES